MNGTIYYIDPTEGSDANDGLSPHQPLKTSASRDFRGGDSVLFKRGTVLRAPLLAQSGSESAPITYGAYGVGAKPRFLGSVPADAPESWVLDRPSIWRCTDTFPGEVCNLIFNGGESCGELRWAIEELKQQGEWHFTGIGASAEGGDSMGARDDILYLCSATNPGLAYQSIECALWGDRKLVAGQYHVIFESLSFANSGVHGFWSAGARDITLRNCDFRFVGGAVWNRERRIRFGNAVEFWDRASDITVDHCFFDNIYDSGVTHQGGSAINFPERLCFRDNVFVDCGMAAYECREPSREIYFEHNTCIRAGGGFSMQGEEPPRQSEIYPQPMGHHVFIWRVEPGTQPGKVTISNNVFYEAPFGAAIYSVIDPADESLFVIDNNCYWQTSGPLLARMSGRDFLPDEFAEYQQTGHDQTSCLAECDFRDAAAGDYRLQDDSPCQGRGIRWAD